MFGVSFKLQELESACVWWWGLIFWIQMKKRVNESRAKANSVEGAVCWLSKSWRRAAGGES